MSAQPIASSGAQVHVLGVRHHGPGSARALQRALEALQPDAVLIELPSDVEPALRWIADAELVPPVALLGYQPDAPTHAVFLPLAEFSPEWVAARYALAHGIALRAIDLPIANLLAAERPDAQLRLARIRPVDPIAELARAAGDDDPERWWDDVVEHQPPAPAEHGDVATALAPFAAIGEAMAAMRGIDAHDPLEARREAAMRQGIRAALAAGQHDIAVVCGAWHVPALASPLPPAAADARTLRGIPKTKIAVAWVPWTHQRLASASGYGAGVASPGWYAHVYRHDPKERIERWFVTAADELRSNGYDASPDHLIAASRLAFSLAALRGRPSAGLAEVLDSFAAVVGEGHPAPIALVHERLVVGLAIGEVPPSAPMVPLARSLSAEQRRLRMKPEPRASVLELDLRKPLGADRSRLLHRLAALGVPWGSLTEGRGSSGTFRETWELSWRPELALTLIERAALGTTVAAAATAHLLEQGAAATSMAELVRLLDSALAGNLPDAVAPLVDRLRLQASHVADLGDVVDALGPLARTARYGDVRGSDASSIGEVFDALVGQVIAGLGAACYGLGDDAAQAMAARLAAAQAALGLVEHPARRSEWPRELLTVARQAAVHGLVRGRAVRLATDLGALDADDAERWFARALSPSVPAIEAAAFVEGFLAGSGTVLGHDRPLLGVVDTWLSSLPTEMFETTVPLLRRTFAEFEPAEREHIGSVLAGGGAPPEAPFGIDGWRAAKAMATVRTMLGAASFESGRTIDFPAHAGDPSSAAGSGVAR